MSGEQDASGRFDYLFEPLDGEVANADAVVAPADEQAQDERRPGTTVTRIGIAAVIIATIAVAATTVMLLLQWPERTDRVDAPPGRSTPSSVKPVATTEAVFEAPPAVTASNIETPTAAVVVEPQPTPQPQPPPAPTTSGSVPAEPVTPSPTVRPPISVAPEPHPPFPNQQPSQGENPDGGLLPGLGGLPGPL